MFLKIQMYKNCALPHVYHFYGMWFQTKLAYIQSVFTMVDKMGKKVQHH